MHIVAFYETEPDALPRLAQFFPAHRALLDEFHAKGAILAAGPLGDPPEGAMAIFGCRSDAESFVRQDPFVTNGLVKSWRLVEWRAEFL